MNHSWQSSAQHVVDAQKTLVIMPPSMRHHHRPPPPGVSFGPLLGEGAPCILLTNMCILILYRAASILFYSIKCLLPAPAPQNKHVKSSSVFPNIKNARFLSAYQMQISCWPSLPERLCVSEEREDGTQKSWAPVPHLPLTV